MSISQAKAEQLAGRLSGGLSCNNARERLLCVIEILRALSDRDHVLSNADIRAILRARFGDGCHPSENTIGADLRALRDSGVSNGSIHVGPSGAWYENSSLSPSKVRLLLNAVQSTRFLTAEQSDDLQKSLAGLVSLGQRGKLQGRVLVDQRVRETPQKVLDTCDLVKEALDTGCKIEFRYTYTNFYGKAIALDSDSGEYVRVETPIALYFSEGYYYMESYSNPPWRREDNFTRSRVDRMYDVKVSKRPADWNNDVEQAKKTAEARLQDCFNMVEGVPRIVFLRVRSDATNVMVDRFGYGLKYAQFNGPMGDKDITAITCVHISDSFTFRRWLSSAGNGIVVVPPSKDALTRRTNWADELGDVEYSKLLEDYEATVQGYLGYLDKARAPYYSC